MCIYKHIYMKCREQVLGLDQAKKLKAFTKVLKKVDCNDGLSRSDQRMKLDADGWMVGWYWYRWYLGGYPRPTNSGVCEGFFPGSLHKNEQSIKDTTLDHSQKAEKVKWTDYYFTVSGVEGDTPNWYPRNPLSRLSGKEFSSRIGHRNCKLPT